MEDLNGFALLGALAGVLLLLVAGYAAFRVAAQSRLRRQLSQQSLFEAAAFADQVRADLAQVKASADQLVRSVRELGHLTGADGAAKRAQLEQGVVQRMQSADIVASSALGLMQPEPLADASAHLRTIGATLERQRTQIQKQCARIRGKNAAPSSEAIA